MEAIAFVQTYFGSVNRARIPDFKRTQQFITQDYDTLLTVINYFDKIVTTPNILTEVNNLANQLGEPERSQCFIRFAQDIAVLEEFYTGSRAIAQNERFPKFGLTDCGILSLVKSRYLFLTDDLRLTTFKKKELIQSILITFVFMNGDSIAVELDLNRFAMLYTGKISEDNAMAL